MVSSRRRALALSFFTVGYNMVEGVVAVIASSSSGSSALLGFGLDSFIESLSGMVMVWRFWEFDVDDGGDEFEAIEQKASRLVAYSFFILGAYVIFQAAFALYKRESPETSVVGIALAVASLIVMPALFVMKYRLGVSIRSQSLIADSKQTLACVLLSAALLTGLVAFSIWKWWWVDSVAALVIAILIIKEGFETLKESYD